MLSKDTSKLIHQSELKFCGSSHYNNYLHFPGHLSEDRKCTQYCHNNRNRKFKNIQSQPRRSFLTESNSYPYSFLLYLHNRNINFQKFPITIPMRILILLIRSTFHLKHSILLAVMKGYSPVDS